MEILYKDVVNDHIIGAIIMAVIFVGFGISFAVNTLIVFGVIGKGRTTIAPNVFFVITSIIIMSIAAYGTFDILREGPTIQYEVRVTDWNVVHDGGYEIIEQRGEIVTLQKKDD